MKSLRTGVIRHRESGSNWPYLSIAICASPWASSRHDLAFASIDDADDATVAFEGGARVSFSRCRKTWLDRREFPVTLGCRVRLGRKLFFDPRVSVDGTVSCSRCHLPALYATDGLPKSHGVRDQVVPRNAPTVLNAGLNFKQHYLGRRSVRDRRGAGEESTASGRAFWLIRTYAAVMARVKAIAGYADLFRAAFLAKTEALNNDGGQLGHKAIRAPTSERTHRLARSSV